MRRWGLCGSGSIAGASAAVSRERASTICWHISACHALGSSADAVPDYSAGFSLPMPDAEASISEEPGARTRHAGICAGAVRATGRPTAMPDKIDHACKESTKSAVHNRGFHRHNLRRRSPMLQDGDCDVNQRAEESAFSVYAVCPGKVPRGPFVYNGRGCGSLFSSSVVASSVLFNTYRVGLQLRSSCVLEAI